MALLHAWNRPLYVRLYIELIVLLFLSVQLDVLEETEASDVGRAKSYAICAWVPSLFNIPNQRNNLYMGAPQIHCADIGRDKATALKERRTNKLKHWRVGRCKGIYERWSKERNVTGRCRRSFLCKELST